MLPIIFFMPFIQLILLSYTATFEIKNINFDVVDFDGSSSSRQLIYRFTSSSNFKLVNSHKSVEEGMKDIEYRRARMILIIPHNFEKAIASGKPDKIQFIINAEDGSAAGVIQSYSLIILQNYNKSLASKSAVSFAGVSPLRTINLIPSYWYNQEMDYKQYMVPGILTMLVTVIGMFLSGMNVVKEKEHGTIEQLNVTPIKKYEFIIGKLLPFLFLALIELAIGLLLAYLLFGIIIRGNIFLIFGLAGIYLLVILSYGLFISTFTETMQQAMFVAWFFAIVFMLMSGLFTPVDSMPYWAQKSTIINPITQFIEIMRRVMLKGAGIADVASQVINLSVYALVMLALSVWKYKKVT